MSSQAAHRPLALLALSATFLCATTPGVAQTTPPPASAPVPVPVPVPVPDPAPAKTSTSQPAPPPSGGPPEILHAPTLERHVEQGILRPVPLSVELPRDLALRARRVLVHYRLWGDPDWITLELGRSGARFVGAVPCREVSTVTGDLKYYIRVHDPAGRVLATGASRARPYRVTIKHDAQLAAGAPRAAKCPDPADCPAGLPGCPSARVVQIACSSDADCEGGQTCSWRGFCERAERRLSWFSVAVEQEVGFVARAGACSLAAQEQEGYACIRDDGVQYLGNPVATNEPIGVGRGPTRVVVGFDRLVDYDLSVGVRLGWAFAGEGFTARDATAFVPLSAALRLSHWFGDDPFARSGWRPHVFVSAGYAMHDIETSVHIREDPTAPPVQGGDDLEQEATLWKRAGDGFAGAGAGVVVSLSSGTALFVEAAALGAFPFGALILAPQAGVMAGF
jgi:hypothetical protein